MHRVRITTTSDDCFAFNLPDDLVVQIEVDGRTYVGVTMPDDDHPVEVVYWRDEDGEDNVTVTPPGVPGPGIAEDDQPALIISRGQLAAMTGRTLTPDFVALMDEVWPNSSIPDALATIGDSIGEETGAYPAWSDQDVADHVLGSGATSYSWWKFMRRLPDGTYHARLENPDHGEETVSTTFTVDDVRRVRGEIIAGEHGVNDTIRDALRDDPDADAVDCLLQVLILGEVTYG